MGIGARQLGKISCWCVEPMSRTVKFISGAMESPKMNSSAYSSSSSAAPLSPVGVVVAAAPPSAEALSSADLFNLARLFGFAVAPGAPRE